MKIGVLSDSHGRADAVREALEACRARGVELVIHCGDIDDAETVRAFAGWTTYFVLGNCDRWDSGGIRRAVAEGGATLHEPFGRLELEGRQIAWLHGDQPDLKRDVERSNRYDYLFYGHTHVAEHHQVGKTLVVNPGALFRARPKTCLVLDLPDGAKETIEIGRPG
jgi:putative phosphoesterase